jgi:hypothetical protein
LGYNTCIHGNATRKLPPCLGGVGTSGRGEEVGKGCRKVNIVQILYTMYINGKRIPIETIPRMGGGGVKENGGGVNSSMMNLIHYKNFCK